MKKSTLLLVGASLLVFSSCLEKKQVAQNTLSTISQKLPNDYMFMQRAYPTGDIKPQAQRKAALWKKSQLQKNRIQPALWEFAGPLNIGGRLTDIEVAPQSPNTIYIGAASGGIFKSTDAGSNWQPIFDDQPMLSIGDIAIAPNNENYLVVGTGEVNAGGGSLAYDGDGVYVSADGGITWENKGLQEVGSIGKILMHPTNSDIFWVGAMGPLFRKDANRGVYKTTDGGDTYEKVLFIAENAGIIDMAIHPTNPDIIYAVSWQRERTTENRIYGGDNSNIYKSINGGTTWNILTNGLPTAGNQKGRISIDIAQSNPDVLYASYANATGSIQGIYKTKDGGNTWATKNSNQLTNVGFHWWFGGLFINPQDENEVYHVGFEMQKTTDGGDNWQFTFPNVHVDQHALAFNPEDPSTVFLGNDGGLYKSTNSGNTSTLDITLPITQFYRMYVDPSNVDKIYGGAQDNSTMRTVTSGLSDWEIINGGDGFQPLIDNTNSSVIYALSQRGNLRKSTNDATSFVSAVNGITNSDRNNWDTPIAFDPQDNNTLFYGTQRVWKSTNMANSWSSISPDLTDGPSSGNLSFGTITTIDISPLNSDIIYVGTDDGNAWRTLDGGSNWSSINTGLVNRWVTRVQASPNVENEVYITFSGYRYGEDTGNVFKSTNSGTTWTDLSANIPDIPVSDIEIDAFDNLFLATDIGVLSSNDAGSTWQPFGDNMPSVVVTDLHYDEGSEFLFAATYGRSIYKTDLSDNALDIAENEVRNNLSIYPNPAQNEVTVQLEGDFAKGTVSIYNQLGQLQIKKSLSTSQNTIDIRPLKAGIYILQLESQGKRTSEKFIKN